MRDSKRRARQWIAEDYKDLKHRPGLQVLGVGQCTVYKYLCQFQCISVCLCFSAPFSISVVSDNLFTLPFYITCTLMAVHAPLVCVSPCMWPSGCGKGLAGGLSGSWPVGAARSHKERACDHGVEYIVVQYRKTKEILCIALFDTGYFHGVQRS